jgi:hypothetical protein
MKARKSARHLGPAHELRAIELCDPELIPEEDEFIEPLDPRFQKQTAYLHECPRCGAVAAIQGLKAAGNLRLELSFEGGTRTKENPWGLYVSKNEKIP